MYEGSAGYFLVWQVILQEVICVSVCVSVFCCWLNRFSQVYLYKSFILLFILGKSCRM